MTTQVARTIMQRWMIRLAGVARAEAGNAAIEFALAAPILIGLLVPVADLGMAFSQQIQVQQAAQAGAQYALLHGYDGSAIGNAVTAATTLASVSAAPAPTQKFACPTGTAIGPAVSSGTSCQDGETAGSYVIVNAQSNYSSVMPYSVLGSSVTLTAQATIRVQ
jgi:Flp pilus assembly protein TadG